MTDIIVIGHGRYPEGIRTNLEMVVGVPENMHFINFSVGQDRVDLEQNLDTLIASLEDRDILFCCDLPGATPFQVAALRAVDAPGHRAVVIGINNMAFMELAMDSQASAADLAEQAVAATKESVAEFP